MPSFHLVQGKGIRGATESSFFGNPNVFTTAIDISGGIECSRTSGTTPCFIQVSASAITFSAVVVNTIGSALSGQYPTAYDDLEYRWDFGDPTGTEIFTNPVTGTSVNANSDQWGPEAAYCYRTVGTKTVTLTIRGRNGSSFVRATATRDITVTAFTAAATWWFDSNATPGGDASSEVQASNLLSLLNTKCTNPTSQTQIWIKRDSNWTGTVTFQPSGTINGMRIGVYGSGADPIFGLSSGSGAGGTFRMRNGSGASNEHKQDIVVSNLAFWLTGSATGAACINLSFGEGTTGLAEDIYLNGCSAHTQITTPLVIEPVPASIQWMNCSKAGNNETELYYTNRIGFWGVTMTDEPGDLGYGMGFLGGAFNWHFFVGFPIVSGKKWFEVVALVHHFYPTVYRHALFCWINFSTGENGNYCINTDWDTQPAAIRDTFYSQARYILIDGCKISGVQNGLDGSNGSSDPTKASLTNYVVQNCAFTELQNTAVLSLHLHLYAA